MVFSSIFFLCFFLPVTVGLYYIVPKKIRNLILLVVSLIFYAWGEPKYILIMLFSTVFDYTNGRLLERFDKKEGLRRLVLIVSLVVNLGLLCYFKYTDFAIENINKLAHTDIKLLKLALPIGISFYTFQTLSYTIDVYRRKVAVQKNILDFGMYICLFPQLIAGPIVRYSDIEKEVKNRQERAELFWSGLVRFCVGLGKKVLLANQIGALWDEISALGNVPMTTAWLGAIAFTFQIYFDFSGYSDMAIGLGMMFGFHFPENFLHPYESKSITEFWRKWHVTLSTWFREYLYIPLGGNRKGKARWILNLFIVWALTGFWHGAEWNFLIWGIFYFILLALEKLFLFKKLEKWPAILSHFYTMFFVIIGWAIFACDDMSLLTRYIGNMFGSFGFADSNTLFYILNYAILLVIMVIGCTSLPKKLATKINSKFRFMLEVEFVLVMILLSIAMLVGDSYNPFLYFRF